MDNFKNYINELSLTKFKKLFYAKTDYDVIEIFKRDFNYKDKIKLIKVSNGGMSNSAGLIEYSSRGVLIHELFHLLQYKAMSDKEKTIYKDLSFEPKKFSEYVLQRKELNNQAISVAYNMYNLNIDIDIMNEENTKNIDINKLDFERSIDRIKYFFVIMNNVKNNRKIDLYKKINNYKQYIGYLDNLNLEETTIYGPTFI